MRSAVISYLAPSSSTQLAALERAGMLGEKLRFERNLITPSQPASTIGPSGGKAAHQQYQQETQSAWSKFGEGLNNILQSGALQSLIDAGLSFYSARQDRKYAEQQAKLARQNAALQERMAQAELEAARREEQRLRELARLQQQQQSLPLPTPQPAGGGIPGWVLPAVGVGAGTLVLVVVMTKRKKK